MLSGLFIILSFFLITDKRFDQTASLMASVIFALSLFLLWAADRSFMTIRINQDSISFKGYLSIRNIKLTHSEIVGYQLKEFIHQSGQRKNMIRVKTSSGKRIIVPEIAYQNYDSLYSELTNRYQYLNFEPLKYAEFYSKTLPVIAAISSLLYLVRALQNLLK